MTQEATSIADSGTAGHEVSYEISRVTLNEDRADFASDLADQHRFGSVGFHLRGTCPRCNHWTSGVCATKYLETKEKSDGGILRRRPRSQITVLKCACISNHDGSKGAFGCGAEWLLHITYSPSDRQKGVTTRAVPDDDAYKCWRAADEVGDAIPNSLTIMQASAGKWQAALTGIVALVGITTAFGGRDAIQAFSTGYRWLFGLSLGLAILFNAIALLFGSLASNGLPSDTNAPSDNDLLNLDLEPLKMTVKARRQLVIAAGASLITLACSAGVLVIYFFSPSANNVQYKVTETIGTGKNATTVTSGCGTISPALPLSGQLPASITFRPVGDHAASVLIPSAKITSVASC